MGRNNINFNLLLLNAHKIHSFNRRKAIFNWLVKSSVDIIKQIVMYSTDKKKPNKERVCERERNGYRTGTRTRTEWERNGYRTDTERILNGNGMDTEWLQITKNGKSILQNANYKRTRSSEQMLVSYILRYQSAYQGFGKDVTLNTCSSNFCLAQRS